MKFVYKNFAILGEQSVRSAEASECAAEEGMFWAYHDAIFEDQIKVNSPLNDETLIAIATKIGLDTTAFTECLQSGRFASRISQDAQSISSLGVRGTPGFLVNGRYISGAQPFQVFEQIIEEELQAKANTGNAAPQPAARPVGPQQAGPPPPPTSE